MARRRIIGDLSLRRIDLVTFSMFISLLTIGWLMIYAVGYGEGYSTNNIGDFLGTLPGNQLIWIAIAITIFFGVYIIDWKFWQLVAYPFYLFSMLLLVGVLIFGSTIKGATSWYSIGGFTLQPSELAKFGTALALSAYLSGSSVSLRQRQSIVVTLGIIGLPMLLILLQPDAGSALIFLSFFIMLYRRGLSENYYILGIFLVTMLLAGLVHSPFYILTALVLLGGFILLYSAKKMVTIYHWLGYILLVGISLYLMHQNVGWLTLLVAVIPIAIIAILQRKEQSRTVSLLSLAMGLGGAIAFAASYFFNYLLESHQQDRINVWLRPELCDPRGSLYNVLQSKMAIGSGGLFGKGFLQGTMTQLNYVPEQTTDFIFCTVGEEQGFVGSAAIIILFFLLILRITQLAERQRSNFSKIYAYCVAGILFLHFFINIGMTMGLMPIIGIPLPFISKGGSALIGFSLMLSVLLKLDADRYAI